MIFHKNTIILTKINELILHRSNANVISFITSRSKVCSSLSYCRCGWSGHYYCCCCFKNQSVCFVIVPDSFFCKKKEINQKLIWWQWNCDASAVVVAMTKAASVIVVVIIVAVSTVGVWAEILLKLYCRFVYLFVILSDWQDLDVSQCGRGSEGLKAGAQLG